MMLTESCLRAVPAFPRPASPRPCFEEKAVMPGQRQHTSAERRIDRIALLTA